MKAMALSMAQDELRHTEFAPAWWRRYGVARRGRAPRLADARSTAAAPEERALRNVIRLVPLRGGQLRALLSRCSTPPRTPTRDDAPAPRRRGRARAARVPLPEAWRFMWLDARPDVRASLARYLRYAFAVYEAEHGGGDGPSLARSPDELRAGVPDLAVSRDGSTRPSPTPSCWPRALRHRRRTCLAHAPARRRAVVIPCTTAASVSSLRASPPLPRQFTPGASGAHCGRAGSPRPNDTANDPRPHRYRPHRQASALLHPVVAARAACRAVGPVARRSAGRWRTSRSRAPARTRRSRGTRAQWSSQRSVLVTPGCRRRTMPCDALLAQWPATQRLRLWHHPQPRVPTHDEQLRAPAQWSSHWSPSVTSRCRRTPPGACYPVTRDAAVEVVAPPAARRAHRTPSSRCCARSPSPGPHCRRGVGRRRGDRRRLDRRRRHDHGRRLDERGRRFDGRRRRLDERRRRFDGRGRRLDERGRRRFDEVGEARRAWSRRAGWARTPRRRRARGAGGTPFLGRGAPPRGRSGARRSSRGGAAGGPLRGVGRGGEGRRRQGASPSPRAERPTPIERERRGEPGDDGDIGPFERAAGVAGRAPGATGRRPRERARAREPSWSGGRRRCAALGCVATWGDGRGVAGAPRWPGAPRPRGARAAWDGLAALEASPGRVRRSGRTTRRSLRARRPVMPKAAVCLPPGERVRRAAADHRPDGGPRAAAGEPVVRP